MRQRVPNMTCLPSFTGSPRFQGTQLGRPHPPGSRLEAEVPLDRVVIREAQLKAVTGRVELEERRLPHIRRRAGDGREDAVMECGRLTGHSTERGQLGPSVRAELDPSLAALDREGNRHALDADDFTDQTGEIGDGTAKLPAEELEQAVLLLRRGTYVDAQQGAPVALEDIPRDVGEDCQGKTADVNPFDLTVVDVVGDDRIAGPPVRVLANPAGAEHVAVADLQEASLELIRHLFLTSSDSRVPARAPRRAFTPHARAPAAKDNGSGPPSLPGKSPDHAGQPP